MAIVIDAMLRHKPSPVALQILDAPELLPNKLTLLWRAARLIACGRAPASEGSARPLDHVSTHLVTTPMRYGIEVDAHYRTTHASHASLWHIYS